MLKSLFVLSFLPLSFFAFSQSEIVQGPFKIDGCDSIFIQKEQNVNYPIALYLKSDNKNYKIESYEVDGDSPNIETVFFTKINNTKNVIVLISWKQIHLVDNIYGKYYQIYGYTYKKNNLTINNEIKKDPELSGLDGKFGDKNLHFKYKDAASIKRYLNIKHK